MENIIQEVFEEIGPGYTESVYHRAMEVALRQRGIEYDSEMVVPVCFRGHVVGNVRCDLVVNKELIVELKTVSRLSDDHRQQLKNYMKLLNMSQGLLVNFGTTTVNVEAINLHT